MSNIGNKTELLNLLGDVKVRVQDKLGIVDFPMPQFILIGKQSVGKSRLIEALAGETFNFISGSLGSRRPTVLEFRNVAQLKESQWYVRDAKSGQWNMHPTHQVMQLVGQRHEELGKSVSAEPVYVRIESPACVDMQIVDLPGFRDFSLDGEGQALAQRIEELDLSFMQNKRNVMLVVEQAGDAATMSSLQRAREFDPEFKRTILIRNKLDKYYGDLTPENVVSWVDGHGDLPGNLVRFALTLPHWTDGDLPPKPFRDILEDVNNEDLRQMAGKSLSNRYLDSIGFKNFSGFMEKKIELMFVDSIGPVLDDLTELKRKHDKELEALKQEIIDTDPARLLTTTRDCGMSFASALVDVMEGVLDSKPCMTFEEELKAFHQHHLANTGFTKLPSEDFSGLADYLDYLRDEARLPAYEVELNGGSAFRRMMHEVEIFLRFSEIGVDTRKRDVIQARGVSMGSLTWRDVVVKLLGNEAHFPLQQRVQYVGERIRWFFEQQKEVVVNFMLNLESLPSTRYKSLYPRHGRVIHDNAITRTLLFETYDAACRRQLQQFTELFESMLTSTFSNPWVFLKGATTGKDFEDDVPDVDTELMKSDPYAFTKKRIPEEIRSRSGTEQQLAKWLNEIPTEDTEIDDAVDKVQMLVLRTYSFIRSQVCDQVELFAESFFKLPMLRRLEAAMAQIELSPQDAANYEARRAQLEQEKGMKMSHAAEINDCMGKIQNFKLKCEARGLRR